MDSKLNKPQTLQQDSYKMTFASGLLLTCFLAYKLQNRSTHLCVLILTSPLVVICFPVILLISKVRGRSQTTLTRFCPLLTSSCTLGVHGLIFSCTPTGVPWCQKIHKNILQTNLLSQCANIQPILNELQKTSQSLFALRSFSIAVFLMKHH